jgi:signal peptidase I
MDRTQFFALWKEWRGTLLFLLLMCAFRSSFADIYNVPTGSMKPTVVEGDRVLTEKMAYDLRLPFTPLVLWHRDDPKRGDIVVLYSPEDGMRLLKRVVAVPGDVVSMRDETVTIDGVPLRYTGPAEGEGAALPDASAYVFEQEDLTGHEHAVMFAPGRPALRDFALVTVPAGQYFVMGDNRDDSKDSRYIGFVPRSAIAGRAFAVGYSLDPVHHYLPRLSRSFQALH